MKITAHALINRLPRLTGVGQSVRQLAAWRPGQPLRLPRPNLQRLMRQLSWPGIAAGALLATTAAFYLSAIRPAEARLETARHNTATLAAQLKQNGAKLHSPAAQLAEYYRLFPREKALPERLEKVFDTAKAQGIELEQGEYKSVRGENGKLMRLQIQLPLKGEYPQIRKFLANLAQEVPSVALANIQFERQKVGDAVIDAQIKLVLFLEQES